MLTDALSYKCLVLVLTSGKVNLPEVHLNTVSFNYVISWSVVRMTRGKKLVRNCVGSLGFNFKCLRNLDTSYNFHFFFPSVRAVSTVRFH
jgi:hypothetical protein